MSPTIVIYKSLQVFNNLLCMIVLYHGYKIRSLLFRSCVYHLKVSEGKCTRSSVFQERRCWTTMDKSSRELLLDEVRIPTSSEKAIFCLASTFWWTILLSKENWCLFFESNPCQITEVSNKHHEGHSRVNIQNMPPHVLTWNFCQRFASMWSKISPNDNPKILYY